MSNYIFKFNPITGDFNIVTDITDIENKLNFDKGYFATITALTTAYPTGVIGDFARVGETDTFWVWDDTSNTWINSSVSIQIIDNLIDTSTNKALSANQGRILNENKQNKNLNVLSLSNFATGGSITTIQLDNNDIININQTTALQNINFENPTFKKKFLILNSGSVSFTINNNFTLLNNNSVEYTFDGNNFILNGYSKIAGSLDYTSANNFIKTINGKLTTTFFNGSEIIPQIPTNDEEVANKKYVDDAIAGGGSGGGHTIKDYLNTSYQQQQNLKYLGSIQPVNNITNSSTDIHSGARLCDVKSGDTIIKGSIVDITYDISGNPVIENIIQQVIGTSDAIISQGTPFNTNIAPLLSSNPPFLYVSSKLDVDKIITAVKTSATNFCVFVTLINGLTGTIGNIYNVTTPTDISYILDDRIAVFSNSVVALLIGYTDMLGTNVFIYSFKISGITVQSHLQSPHIYSLATLSSNSTYGIKIRPYGSNLMILKIIASTATVVLSYSIDGNGLINTTILSTATVATTMAITPNPRNDAFEVLPSGKFYFTNGGGNIARYGYITGNTITVSSGTNPLPAGGYYSASTCVIDNNRFAMIYMGGGTGALNGNFRICIYDLSAVTSTVAGNYYNDKQILSDYVNSVMPQHISIYLASVTSTTAVIGLLMQIYQGVSANPNWLYGKLLNVDLINNNVISQTFTGTFSTSTNTITSVTGLDWGKIAIGKSVIGNTTTTKYNNDRVLITGFNQVNSTITLDKVGSGNGVVSSLMIVDVLRTDTSISDSGSWNNKGAILNGGKFVVSHYSISATKILTSISQIGNTNAINYSKAKAIAEQQIGSQWLVKLINESVYADSTANYVIGTQYGIQADGTFGTTNLVYILGTSISKTEIKLNTFMTFISNGNISININNSIELRCPSGNILTFKNPYNATIGNQVFIGYYDINGGLIPHQIIDVVEKTITTFGRTTDPALSVAGQCVEYFNTTTGKKRISKNGGAYIDII